MTGFAFGETRYIDPEAAGIALVTTVIFLASCDYATHILEEIICHSSTYMSMLQKIYKELMMMGTIDIFLFSFFFLDFVYFSSLLSY
jgi:hypothetical protein